MVKFDQTELTNFCLFESCFRGTLFDKKRLLIGI